MNRFKEFATPLSVLLLASAMLFDHFVGCPDHVPTPGPGPNDAKTAGHAYGVHLATTNAQAWLDAAAAFDAGKTVAEAQAVMQASWLTARQAALSTDLAPVMDSVLPEGAEPTASQRTALSACWRAIAAGEGTVK